LTITENDGERGRQAYRQEGCLAVRNSERYACRMAGRLAESRLAGKETCRKTCMNAGFRQACILAASRLPGKGYMQKGMRAAGKQACRLEVSWLTGRD